MEASELATVSTEHIDYWVEDGILYLGKSSNGHCGYGEVLSTIGTDEYSQGSCQKTLIDIKVYMPLKTVIF